MGFRIVYLCASVIFSAPWVACLNTGASNLYSRPWRKHNSGDKGEIIFAVEVRVRGQTRGQNSFVSKEAWFVNLYASLFF